MLRHAEQMFRRVFRDQADYDAFCGVARDGGSVAVYVSKGRWVADCECEAGIGCPDPAWGTHGVCRECHARYELEWPDELAEIVAALEPRPVKAQNWLVGEPVGALFRENELMAHELRT